MMSGTWLNGGQLLALLIVIIVFSASIYKQKIKANAKRHQQYDDRETKAMHQKVEQLEQRVQVLERIITEQGYQVAREIDALANKPSPHR